MSLFKEDLKEQDEVYCVFNHAIKGRITKKACFHGLYLYSVKVDDEKSFKTWFGLNSDNVKWLHCQLRKIYTEVKKNGNKKTRRSSKSRKGRA